MTKRKINTLLVLFLLFALLAGCSGLKSAGEDPAGAPAPEAALAALEGLPIGEFFDESFYLILQRDPELVVELGLGKVVALEKAELTNMSDEYARETQQLESAILAMLREYDRNTLSPDQQISYDVYEWYLDDLVRGHEFLYYDYTVTHFLLTSTQTLLKMFFTDVYPITSKQDAEDYVARLYMVDDKFAQLIKGLKVREQAGIIPPRFSLQWALSDMKNMAGSDAAFSPFLTVLQEKVNALEGLSQDEKNAIFTDAKKAVSESVIPAYANLEEYIRHLKTVAPTDDGVWQFEHGEAYYVYTLRHHNTTELTPDEIHALGLRELERIHAEMRAIFAELGYPAGESLSQSYGRVAQDGGHIPGNKVVQTYEEILDHADQNLDAAFDIRPVAELIVVGGDSGAYYNSASLDGSRPGAFYAIAGGRGEPYYKMPTIAYHEGIPGHHYQIALAQEMDLPLFRNVVVFNAYAEGWALYAEGLANELGWYDDDPYGNLGRLQLEAFRAVRLVVDTGIHAKGWTYGQGVDFFVENVGRSQGMAEYEVARYITLPGQATSYMIGSLKILELRQRAMDALGADFDIIEFHRVVLSNGSMPLEILEQVVDNYIEAKLAE